MKAKPMLVALMLAGALGAAEAKQDNGLPAAQPVDPAALQALIDAYLAQQPGDGNHLGQFFADNPELLPYKHDWDVLVGHGHDPITSPIPEPETYALLLAGLGALAIARKRRQNED